MAIPVSYDYRKKIVRMRKQGKTIKAIAQSVGYSQSSVKRIWSRFDREGETGLSTQYHQSGRRSPYKESIPDKIKEVRDNEQGAPYVRSLLLEQYPELAIPHERTLQRWWEEEGINHPKGRRKHKSDWTDEPNHTWQIDGKGHLELKDDLEVSWMKVADEASSCELHTRLFPQPLVEAIPGDKACQAINECFVEWGLPRRIKIDNGVPFANACKKDIPTLTQLWWIGLGIEVQLNTPKVPQQNGTVEGLQRIGHRWSAPHLYKLLEPYQQRINETSRIQREVYRIRRKGDKTRKELYPKLWENPHKYDSAHFDMQRIYDNLTDRIWKREVHKGGVARFWGDYIYVGKPFKHYKVTITFDPLELQWIVRATDGRLLKTSNKQFFTEAQILEHTGISKN